jgi:hypothetical protein
MTTATEDRIAALREEISEDERQMGIHAGDPYYAMYATRAREARDELRQMEKS